MSALSRLPSKVGYTSPALDQDELYARLGSSIYKRGFHVHQGALVQPAALVRGLAANLPQNVSLFESSAVQQLKYNDSITAQLATGEIVTDILILATNYEAPKLGQLNHRILGSTLSCSFTRVLNANELQSLGSKRQWGVLSLHGGGATVRLTADGRICLRNTAEYFGANLLSDRQLHKRQSIHREAFERRFPQLRHVPFEYGWSGVEGISRNGTNLFGQQRKKCIPGWRIQWLGRESRHSIWLRSCRICQQWSIRIDH
jgi:glycine/D-amino acid oxidase-like deaminating enzyme